jgi:hypothetical protein
LSPLRSWECVTWYLSSILVMYFTLVIPSFLVQEDVNFLLTSWREKMAFSWSSIACHPWFCVDYIIIFILRNSTWMPWDFK